MCDGTGVPSFRPTDDWSADWPHDVAPLVRVLASVTGPAAASGWRASWHPSRPLAGPAGC